MAKLECNYDYIPSYMTGRAHSFAHVIIPVSTMLYLRIDETDHWLDAGNIAFVGPHVFHRVICTERVIWFNIPKEMIMARDLPYLEANPIFPVSDYLLPLVALIRSECLNDLDSDSLRYLFYYLYSKLMHDNKPKSVRYIESRYAEPIKVAALAQMENYNTAYFIEWFQNKTGMTPGKYLNQVRIDKAKVLLANTDYRIVDIALQVGYNNSSSFSRAFKAIAGTTPLQYRKDNQAIARFSQLPYWQTM